MVSAELLFELGRRVSEAARPTGTYKLRPDKSPRPFGGFNILLFGDWWQLPPVQSTALFEQPSKAKRPLMHHFSREKVVEVVEVVDEVAEVLEVVSTAHESPFL